MDDIIFTYVQSCIKYYNNYLHFYKNYNILLLSTIYTAMKHSFISVMHTIHIRFTVNYIYIRFKYQKSTVYYSSNSQNAY